MKTKGDIMLKKAEDATLMWAYDLSFSGTSDLTLLDNAQFIYELSLAELELKALGADFELTNGLREFKIHSKSRYLIDVLKRRTAYFKAIGHEFTDYFQIIQKNRTRSVNQYLTHWIYPYKGKFHPHDYMTGLGFKLEKNILKLIFGLYNMMKKEHILIFKKAA
ncbi:hypothetical protein [Dissulfurispira thermophila]|nr:hypothetical protein [Dissulfurispira thermophila]